MSDKLPLIRTGLKDYEIIIKESDKFTYHIGSGNFIYYKHGIGPLKFTNPANDMEITLEVGQALKCAEYHKLILTPEYFDKKYLVLGYGDLNVIENVPVNTFMGGVESNSGVSGYPCVGLFNPSNSSTIVEITSLKINSFSGGTGYLYFYDSLLSNYHHPKNVISGNSDANAYIYYDNPSSNPASGSIILSSFYIHTYTSLAEILNKKLILNEGKGILLSLSSVNKNLVLTTSFNEYYK